MDLAKLALMNVKMFLQLVKKINSGAQIILVKINGKTVTVKTDAMFKHHINAKMEHVLLHHGKDLEKMDVILDKNVLKINLTNAEMDNVLEIEITAEFNYHAQKISISDVQIKLALIKHLIALDSPFVHLVNQYFAWTEDVYKLFHHVRKPKICYVQKINHTIV